MYEQKVIDRLGNLKYLDTLKAGNISMTSKTNQFNDVVKFIAQINKDEIIQQISYKATGCTYFLVFCDFFCELVEGKSIKNALKINSEKLSSLASLDKSKIHIIDIILNTFDTMIKKYRTGVEKGSILPFAVIEKKDIKPIKVIEEAPKKNKVITNDDLSDILYKKPVKTKTPKVASVKTEEEIAKAVVDGEHKETEKQIEEKVDSKIESKKTNVNESIETPKQNSVKEIETNKIHFNIKDIKSIKENKQKAKAVEDKNTNSDIDDIINRIKTTKLTSKNNLAIKQNSSEIVESSKDINNEVVLEKNELDKNAETKKEVSKKDVLNIDTKSKIEILNSDTSKENKSTKDTSKLSSNLLNLKSMLTKNASNNVEKLQESKKDIEVTNSQVKENKVKNLSSMLNKLDNKNTNMNVKVEDKVDNKIENKVETKADNKVETKEKNNTKPISSSLASISQGLSSIRKTKIESANSLDIKVDEKTIEPKQTEEKKVTASKDSSTKNSTKKNTKSTSKKSSKSSSTKKNTITKMVVKEEPKVEEDIFAGLKHIDDDDDYEIPAKKKKGLFNWFKKNK